MKYCIRTGHPVGAELQRIAVGMMDEAIALLHDESETVEKRVHEIRKRCKMLRALFRLLGMGEENRRFRDIGRELSGSRDVAVIYATFEAITEPGEFEELRAELRRKAESVGGVLDPAPVEPRIREARDLELEVDFETVVEATVRFYRRGRKALQGVRDHASPDAVHEWRKRVKDHWYHMRLLADICRAVAAPRRDPLDDLQEKLGLSNDLVILRHALDDAVLIDRIGERRAALVRESIALGEQLYEAKPRAFRDSLRTCHVG
ncbi:MAG: CHAD domain-containing protein [Planctomycetota bacterium]